MGDPKRQKKHYERPKKIWDKAKVEERRQIAKGYGLKNRREIWKSETFLRKKRATARKLLVQQVEARKKREKEFIESLVETGVLKKNATLDDVLGLKVEAVLERRLETIVWRQELSATLKQARQLITHGHIGINGKKITVPGYHVRKEEEGKIGFLDKTLEIKIKKAAQKKREIQKIPEKTAGKPEAAEAKPAVESSPEGKKKAVEGETGKVEEERGKPEEGKKSGERRDEKGEPEKVREAKPQKKEKPKEKKKGRKAKGSE